MPGSKEEEEEAVIMQGMLCVRQGNLVKYLNHCLTARKWEIGLKINRIQGLQP